MKSIYIHMAALMLANTTISSAQDTQPKPAAVKELDAIALAQNKAQRESVARYRKMSTEPDKAKKKELYLSGVQAARANYKKVFEIIKKTPETPSALAGLKWAHLGLNKEDLTEALSIVTQHHKEDIDITRILVNAYSKKIIDADGIRELIESVETEATRQGFTFTLAALIDTPDHTNKESLALYKKIKNWPNIAETNPDLLSLVNGRLFLTEKLSIGQVAPDIIGTDHEGKEFKLSDYRGKVVLLDFWGIW